MTNNEFVEQIRQTLVEEFTRTQLLPNVRIHTLKDTHQAVISLPYIYVTTNSIEYHATLDKDHKMTGIKIYLYVGQLQHSILQDILDTSYINSIPRLLENEFESLEVINAEIGEELDKDGQTAFYMAEIQCEALIDASGGKEIPTAPTTQKKV